MIWWPVFDYVIGSDRFNIEKLFVLPIVPSTWIRTYAIFLPSSTSLADSCACSRKGWILRSVPTVFCWSPLVNPLICHYRYNGFAFDFLEKSTHLGQLNIWCWAHKKWWNITHSTVRSTCISFEEFCCVMVLIVWPCRGLKLQVTWCLYEYFTAIDYDVVFLVTFF